jgi:5-methyltetrahydrofolate--homocysteine methyltransferase
MDIDFTPARWARIRKDYADWWAGRLERPLIAVTLTGYEPRMPKPTLPIHHFTSFYGLDAPVDKVLDTWQWRLEGQRYLGDGFPAIWPNFGAGVMAAFLGCDLRNSIDGGTAWFHPRQSREARDLHFVTDQSNPWFRRVREIAQAADHRFGGLAQIGMTDLGGNLDILSSFRPGEQLLLDLYDCPAEVDRLTWEAHACWWEYFEALCATMPHNPGYTAWTPIFSQEPYYMLQCDFCYMIGPKMFDRFVKPELAATCRRLKNAFYHLDGPGQLPHLDSLLEIPELKGVQWVPGAGQPGITKWPDVYRKILAAGKRIQIFSSQGIEHGLETLDVLADQLGTAKGLIMIAAADRADEDKVAAFLERYGADRALAVASPVT